MTRLSFPDGENETSERIDVRDQEEGHDIRRDEHEDRCDMWRERVRRHDKETQHERHRSVQQAEDVCSDRD